MSVSLMLVGCWLARGVPRQLRRGMLMLLLMLKLMLSLMLKLMPRLMLMLMHKRGSYLIVSTSANTIASRVPATRLEGSMYAVPGFLSLCVRKLHSPAEEEDDEENKEKTKTKKMKKKKDEEKEKENGKETKKKKKKEKVATRESERATET